MKMKNGAMRLLALISATLTVAAGCTVTVVDPPEDVTTLSGMWLINGVQADADSCAAAGISTIRFEVANDPAGADVAYQFDFACARGSFDSRRDADASDVFLPRPIMFYSHYQALDAGGVLVGETDYLELDTAVVTHAITATPDFTFAVENTLRVNFLWETGIDTESFGTCVEANLDETFGYTLTDSSGATVSEMFGLLCEDALDFTPLASDIYSIDITGMASDGRKWGGVCSDLDVASGVEEYDCLIMVIP